MKNLFIRLYVLLILTFLGLGWSLDQLYDEITPADNVPTDLDLHRGTLFLLNRELARLPEPSHSEYMQAISPSFGYPVSLVALTNLETHLSDQGQMIEATQLHYLTEGGQVSIFDNHNNRSWFLQRQGTSEQVIVFGPIQLLTDSNNTLFSAIFLLVLAMIVFVWVWPLSRGLMTLTKAAQQFGEGDFSTRVSENIARPLQPVALRFNAMAARIQRLIRSHKELSHAVSHELRTPIARIRFAIEMTREVTDEQKRDYYFDAVNTNIEELDGLVDELLTYARFDREEPSLSFLPNNICELTHDVVKGFEMTESHLHFTIETQDPELTAACDANAIKRVLDNLLRNAIRYAETSITVTIRAHGNRVIVVVEDDGPGIPEANWDTLFDPFVRLDQSRDRNSGGIGLGLAIVRRYMEWHGGTASVSKVEPHGARFELNWPIEHRDT